MLREQKKQQRREKIEPYIERVFLGSRRPRMGIFHSCDQGQRSFTLVIKGGDAPPQGRPRVWLPPLGDDLTPK